MILRTPPVAALLSMLLMSTLAAAEESAPARSSGLEHWRLGRLQVYLDDFGELTRYREANAQLPAPGIPDARVVFFGDSITDGRGSTEGENRRWPDFLARRLLSNRGTAPIGVLNEGIGGNCVWRGGIGYTGV